MRWRDLALVVAIAVAVAGWSVCSMGCDDCEPAPIDASTLPLCADVGCEPTSSTCGPDGLVCTCATDGGVVECRRLP